MSVEVNNESGVDVDEAEIVALARHVLAQMRVHPQAELSVVLVDETAMEQLHVQWMDEPGPTDVLSFPMDELRPGTEDHETPAGLLGDIVDAYGRWDAAQNVPGGRGRPRDAQTGRRNRPAR